MITVIKIGDAMVVAQDGGSITTFYPDGASWGAHAHDTPHYHVIAHRCGYGDDLWRYCLEHEVAHLFLAHNVGTYNVLWHLAHREPVEAHLAAVEELFVQTFQRWVRANERPIVGDMDWDGLRAKFLDLVG